MDIWNILQSWVVRRGSVVLGDDVVSGNCSSSESVNHADLALLCCSVRLCQSTALQCHVCVDT